MDLRSSDLIKIHNQIRRGHRLYDLLIMLVELNTVNFTHYDPLW